jgi:hypothetical protein
VSQKREDHVSLRTAGDGSISAARGKRCRPRPLVIMPPGKTRSHMRGFVGAVLGLPARQHFLMRSPIGSYLHP